MKTAIRPPTNWDEVPLVFDIPLACRMLGKSQENVKKMCQRGAIPAFKAGKEWRFEKGAVMAWIERQTTGK